MADNSVTNVKNWPDLVFKFVLTLIGGGLFILGTFFINKLDKVTDSQDIIKDMFVSMDKKVEKVIGAVDYLRDDVKELQDENKELRREIERLKEVNRLR